MSPFTVVVDLLPVLPHPSALLPTGDLSPTGDLLAGLLRLADPPLDPDDFRPDAGSVPKSALFTTLVNGLLYLGVISAVAGLVGGAIAFAVGPLFGSHGVSERGKAMMWKACGTAVVIGSGVSVLSWLMAK